MKRIILAGITGKTGKEVAKVINSAPNFDLVAAVGNSSAGQNVGYILEGKRNNRFVFPDVKTALENCEADVYIDFTHPDAVVLNAKHAVKNGLDVIIGTTGLTNEFIDELTQLIRLENRFGILSSNFSLGTVMLTKMGKKLRDFFGADKIHIFETHHISKIDKPSGTALYLKNQLGESIDIHSLRVHGRVSRHELCVNLDNESITIAHEVTNAKVFGAGVLYILKTYHQIDGVYHDLASFVERIEQMEFHDDLIENEQTEQLVTDILIQTKKYS